MQYWVVSFYQFFPIENPEKEADFLQTIFEKRGCKGRIYVSKEGVNAQFSGKEDEVKKLLQELKAVPSYQDISVKIQPYSEQAFYKMQVKVRELVAFEQTVDLSNRGEELSSEKWKEKLESPDENQILIDARNNYESAVGHFEGAILPDLDSFRDFPSYTDELLKGKDPKNTTIMMYCTGGIRCEYYSAYVKSKGFEKVYQLKGGIIQYGQEVGDDHWKGKLFVFDDRLLVSICDKNQEDIAFCHFCGEASDLYYNCANMDCNALFLACPACSTKNKGCCSSACLQKGRVRPFDSSSKPKPFRKWKKEEKQKLSPSSPTVTP